jgi:hypothetical protein
VTLALQTLASFARDPKFVTDADALDFAAEAARRLTISLEDLGERLRDAGIGVEAIDKDSRR